MGDFTFSQMGGRALDYEMESSARWVIDLARAGQYLLERIRLIVPHPLPETGEDSMRLLSQLYGDLLQFRIICLTSKGFS